MDCKHVFIQVDQTLEMHSRALWVGLCTLFSRGEGQGSNKLRYRSIHGRWISCPAVAHRPVAAVVRWARLLRTRCTAQKPRRTQCLRKSLAPTAPDLPHPHPFPRPPELGACQPPSSSCDSTLRLPPPRRPTCQHHVDTVNAFRRPRTPVCGGAANAQGGTRCVREAARIS